MQTQRQAIAVHATTPGSPHINVSFPRVSSVCLVCFGTKTDQR